MYNVYAGRDGEKFKWRARRLAFYGSFVLVVAVAVRERASLLCFFYSYIQKHTYCSIIRIHDDPSVNGTHAISNHLELTIFRTTHNKSIAIIFFLMMLRYYFDLPLAPCPFINLFSRHWNEENNSAATTTTTNANKMKQMNGSRECSVCLCVRARAHFCMHELIQCN